MNELRNIFEDIKNRKYIESYVVLIVGIGVLILDIVADLSSSVMTEAILAILSVLIYFSILERREYSKLLERRDIIGISRFSPKRSGEHPLDKYLPNAKSEVAMLAVQHSSVVHQYLGLLEEKAKAGCRVKILMMAPRDQDGNVNPNVYEYESHRQYTSLQNKLEASADTFRGWLNLLDNHVRERVEIRMYREHPTATYFFIDKDEPNGFVQVELLIYGVHAHYFPRYTVMKKDNEDFFKIHIDSFEKLWGKSPVLSPLTDNL